jgi:hypothetical protein
MRVNLSSSLNFKGFIDDLTYIRVYRVYNDNFIWYTSTTSSDGTIITRGSEAIDKPRILEKFDELIEKDLIDIENVNNFLK